MSSADAVVTHPYGDVPIEPLEPRVDPSAEGG
jgi:hypothetical protein